MPADSLFNFQFNHWQAFLLSFIPAVITLISIIYFWKFPLYKINKVYILYLISILAWQLNDSFSRISISIETARMWDRLLSFAWIMQFPSCIHFVMLLMGKIKQTNKSWFILFLYFPFFLFAILLSCGIYSQSYLYSTFWGWTKTFTDFSSFQIVPAIWVCLAIMYTIFLFGSFAYQNRRSTDRKFISLLMFIGYIIPAVIGITIQVIFPLFLKIQPVPVTSTLMVTVVIVLTQLIAYKIFNLSERLDSERITEIIQEIIFVVSPQYSITYINPFGANVVGVKTIEIKKLHDIFQNSERSYDAFKKQIIIPGFEKKQVLSSQFLMHDSNGKEIYWHVSTYPIFNRKNIEGLLVMCRDITDQMLMAETKLMALRSQMNPHFIFNSLNSIQHYIHSNQKETAESFLSTFAILIRQILDNSSNALILLSDELSTIELYLKLEKVRFGKRLTYEINIDADIDIDNTLVPSMLIQPYIENAIIHGLALKDEGGKIVIQLKKKSESIICVIEDNGGGRKKAAELKDRNMIKKKSYGISITQARLEILNQQLNIPVAVKIIDLYDTHNFPCGTRVEINIPFQERF